MLGPDEPRYAAIGQAIAESGDWVTPRSWGSPWFEKPPLLYWTTAVAFKAGLNQDAAPRLPVAILSAAFLIFFYLILTREFGRRAALFSSTILATSVGWLAYSHVGVTDLPLSTSLGASMLLLLRGQRPRPLLVASGAFLGLAVLAKGLVPLALFLPALWWMRKRLFELAIVLASATVIAAPWYVLVTLRNGSGFIDEFFWKQQFARIASASLMHVRPFWFYVPVLLAALFPWTPLLITLISRKFPYKDPRVRFLLAWFLWGFLMFSAVLNKLPGYLLPLLPAVATLLGISLAQLPSRNRVLAACLAASGILLSVVPSVAASLPQMLVAGLSHTGELEYHLGYLIPALILALICGSLEYLGRRGSAMALVAIGMVVAVAAFVENTYPVLDRTVSPRKFWKTHENSTTCVSEENRSWRYGLDYYTRRNLPDCN